MTPRTQDLLKIRKLATHNDKILSIEQKLNKAQEHLRQARYILNHLVNRGVK